MTAGSLPPWLGRRRPKAPRQLCSHALCTMWSRTDGIAACLTGWLRYQTKGCRLTPGISEQGVHRQAEETERGVQPHLVVGTCSGR